MNFFDINGFGVNGRPSDIRWQPGALPNGFMLIVGGSGSGKTTAVRKLMRGLISAKMPVVAVDFHGDMTRGVKGFQAIALSGSHSSQVGLSPLDIDPIATERSGLKEQVNGLRDVIADRIKSIGHNQKQLLGRALAATYERAGIVEDKPETWTRPVPPLSAVLDALKESDEKEAKGLLAMADDIFGHAIFSKPRYLSATAMIQAPVHIDMSAIGSDEVKAVATDTILRGIMRALRARGDIVSPKSHKDRFRAFLVIDEARHAGTATTETIFREARKFGLGAILAAQVIDDFAPAVRAQAATWLLLRHETRAEAARSAKEFGIEPDLLTSLPGDGAGLFRCGRSDWCRVQVVA